MAVLTREQYEQMPEPAKLRLLGLVSQENWLDIARPEQIPPRGDWYVWYLMGGRGSGKTRTGAEWLSQAESDHEPGEWAILAPSMNDAITTCVEQTLLKIEGFASRVENWNRSRFELWMKSGSRIFLDGADDGALRIQGRNLRGCWADEIGLWKDWDTAWNESLAFAVRQDPSRIVATGTPKMGHPLVKQLVDDPDVPVSHMRMEDNIANLNPVRIQALYDYYGESRQGRQELDGEWLEAIEGDLLKRAWWRYFEPQAKHESFEGYKARLPRFQTILVSVDTPLKDKQASDNVAIQVWGVDKANRYLLSARCDKMGYDECRRAVKEMSQWARREWRNCPRHRTIIENAGYGAELIVDLKREIGFVEKWQANMEGTKGMRAFAAAQWLETGNVYLPGRMRDDLSGPDEKACPNFTLSLIDEAALFQLDGSHKSHDDQVDAWSQAMNWLRDKQYVGGKTYNAFKQKRR